MVADMQLQQLTLILALAPSLTLTLLTLLILSLNPDVCIDNAPYATGNKCASNISGYHWFHTF